MNPKRKQNEISHIYLSGSNLAQREQEVMKDASEKLGFTPEKISGRSNWWGSSEIGAFFVTGTFKNFPAVLKIQGVKTETSEIFMIDSFSKENKSKLIRPPKIYASLPWNHEKRYEALILEPVRKRVVDTPTTPEQLDRFFEIYSEYRKNCISSPWLNKPDDNLSKRVEDNFKIWRKATYKLFPTHPLRENEDEKLIDMAVEILKKGYENVEFEFQHGHFSERDLYQQDENVVLLSNLYWGWKAPLYDAVFGMHWFIYHLEELDQITPELVEEQRQLWTSKIEALSNVKANPRLYHLALLERAAAGLNLDALSIDFKKPIAKHLVEKTRHQLIDLLKITS